MNNEMTAVKSTNIVPTDTTQFEGYLEVLGLPKENVLADPEQRGRLITNLRPFIDSLDETTKQNGRYLSKFVAASAIGLFDAALNYVWNEVVVNLRKKIIIYGLDLFFDAALGGSKREDYSKEEDLPGIKDNTLLNTCCKLELISEIVYKKLNHILNMRNDIGSSHPNTYSINAFELLGWLETCVKDVLNDMPSDAAIQIQSFIINLKTNKTLIDQTTITSMEQPLKELSIQNTNNLLNNIFGMFVSEKTDVITRKNISSIASFIWKNSGETVKVKLGIMLDGYKHNMHEKKYEFGKEFFQLCDGNEYKTLESKIIEMDELIDNLLEARYGRDNFHTEPSHIRKILSYIKTENDIPKERVEKLIKTILICRVGKGTNYCDGVSPNGRELYDNFFALLGDKNIGLVLTNMHSFEICSTLHNQICLKQMLCILNILKTNAISDRLKEIIDYLIKKEQILYNIHRTKEYQELSRPIIDLSKIK